MTLDEQTAAIWELAAETKANLQSAATTLGECREMVETISRSSAVLAGWNASRYFTDAELEEAAEAADLIERADAGWFRLEPAPQPDSWPVPSAKYLTAEFGDN